MAEKTSWIHPPHHLYGVSGRQYGVTSNPHLSACTLVGGSQDSVWCWDLKTGAPIACAYFADVPFGTESWVHSFPRPKIYTTYSVATTDYIAPKCCALSTFGYLLAYCT
jgi:hypothetical protein